METFYLLDNEEYLGHTRLHVIFPPVNFMSLRTEVFDSKGRLEMNTVGTLLK
jgi:hypothetical protein